MLEAIFKLLKLEVQVAVAVMTLVSGVALWLLRPLVRRVWNALERSKAQPAPERQDPEVTVAPATARSRVIARAPVATSTPRELPADKPAAMPPLQGILGAPDHALYVTSNSELVIVHPRSDELLEMVDRIGVAALHKDGSPFMELSPDTSVPVGDEGVFTMEDVPEFVDEEAIWALPMPDGKLWLRRMGSIEVLCPRHHVV